jgi:CRISPR-associated protein Cmr1
MLKKITFEIETITPMFLAGANQGKAELRAASIKGLLRFWWRAMQAEPDIEKLRNRESQIFGSSDEKTGGGSSFSIRIAHEGALKTSKEPFPKQNISITSKGKTFPVNILEYLAYGTLEYKKEEKKNVFIREYIPNNTKFSLILGSRDYNATEALKALYVFNLFGGVGSRSRNGFGSFQIVNAEKAFESIVADCYISQPYSNDNLKKMIKQVGLSSYSSFSQEVKIFKTKAVHDTWDKALGEIGKIYRGIRSSDIKKDNQTFESKHFYDKRQYLGAPLDPPKETFKSILDRHAKPFFIKVAKEGNKYRSYILYLPSQYCAGKDADRNGKNINHSTADGNFIEVCNEFNKFLGEHLEAIL